MTERQEGESLGDYAKRIAERMKAHESELRATDAHYDARCRIEDTLVEHGLRVENSAYVLDPEVTLVARGMVLELPSLAGAELRIVAESISRANASFVDVRQRVGGVEAATVRAIRQLFIAQRDQAQKWLDAHPEGVCDQARPKGGLRIELERTAHVRACKDVEDERASKNRAYDERNRLVSALSKHYPSHLAKHPESDAEWERDWMNIVFVETPQGQLSWHLHDSDMPLFEHLPSGPNNWDGHTNEEKYARLARLNPEVQQP